MSNPRFADASSRRRNAVPFVVEASYAIVQPGPSMTIVTRTSVEAIRGAGTTAPTAAKTAAIDASQATTNTPACVRSRIRRHLPLSAVPPTSGDDEDGGRRGRGHCNHSNDLQVRTGRNVGFPSKGLVSLDRRVIATGEIPIGQRSRHVPRR